jgi:hypothetical protein
MASKQSTVGREDWMEAYVAGLVDNHSGIVVTVGKDDNRRIGYRVSAECRIKLSSEDTANFLEEFCERNDITYREKTKSDRKYTTYELIISRRKDLKQFLERIKPYLVARKDAAGILSETIIPRMEAGDHQQRETFVDLMRDIETFRELSGRANRTKYDREYFVDEWDLN